MMAGVQLHDYQEKALGHMHNGCILCGNVGSGKSRTGLAYYYILFGGRVNTKNYVRMNDPPDLYIITTAKKRDSYEWEQELLPFCLSPKHQELYSNKVVIDSWNNIKKYKDVEGAFFIFDEDRVTGSGVWVKTFLTISKHNRWVILSATPGDTWIDYIPVFIANGFFKNKTHFNSEHVIYRYGIQPYPVIEGFRGTGRLTRLRDKVLVKMDYKNPAKRHHEDIYLDWDQTWYKSICKDRWNTWKDKPIETASEFCQCLRRVVNSDQSRELYLLELYEKHPKMIIFYNYDYELELLESMAIENGIVFAEWNGHLHQEIPASESWLYLVQYTAGCEGWNCIKTDTIVFYSQNYSYKIMTQAAGRIDRLNTPYNDLYYYHLKSRSGIDLAITKALKLKKKFNENVFVTI